MKKKALIMTTTLLVVIALAVGVTFAVWNVNSESKDFNVKVGKNIDLSVSFAGYNSSAAGENIYTGSEENQLPCDDMILIPNGAILNTNVNNAFDVLFGTFTITGNGGWDKETLKATYQLKSFMLDDADANTIFEVKVLPAIMVNVNGDYVSRSAPKSGAVTLNPNDSALGLNGVYYVFVSFKAGFTESDATSATDFRGKSLKINLEINAAVISG